MSRQQHQAGPSISSGSDSHICQRCHQPLILDPSIQDVTSSQLNLIKSAIPTRSTPSTLPASSKLNLLPPSSQPGAKIWGESNSIPSTSSRNNAVAESFILLSDSSIFPQHAQSNNNHHSAHSTTNTNIVDQLHSVLSSETSISHPLCTECTLILTNEFQKLTEELTKERDAYIRFEREILRNRETQNQSKSSSSYVKRISKSDNKDPNKAESETEALGEFDIEGNEDEWNELMKRKKELEDEEEKLRVVLEEREKELKEVEMEEEKVKRDEEEVDREETKYLLQHAELSTHSSHLQSELTTAKTHLLLSRSLLSHLESTNVYNDAFQIGHVPLESSSSSSSSSNHGITVGTINGLRLGGRPHVEWDEINAAWGLTALCLDRIADKVGFVFKTYKIVPLGSYSRIEELPPSRNVYELYASSDLSPARLLQNRRFNYALISILNCLKQLIEFGKLNNKGWANNNIEIHKDKISNHSIKLPGISSIPSLTLPSMSIMGLGSTSTSNQSSSSSPSSNQSNPNSSTNNQNDNTAEENWTKACRAVLVILKRILMVESQMDRSTLSN
ncbi:uncharacterized protein L201_001175 [Kwoniella dendrophila CBS 6074]|uniref:Autophagy-related protein 6 n=1 Tax=Kwoniella dendrophila CBS 6074 TaxID=1295534 RepID=A0AAX4JLJ0_9TREE